MEFFEFVNGDNLYMSMRIYKMIWRFKDLYVKDYGGR